MGNAHPTNDVQNGDFLTLKLILENAVLLAIDFQKDFMESIVSTVGTDVVVPKAKQVLEVARRAKIPIIHTQEVHRKELVDFGRELDGAEPIHCLENEPGTDFHPELLPIEGEFTVPKRRYSAFFATDLDILLRGLKADTIVLMGALTDVCVHYTAVDAHQHDYHFFVLEDCCIGSDWEAHRAAIKAMVYLQKNACLDSRDFVNFLKDFKNC
ncbi:cysteine hydrolase family protein [Baaleninema simplex]|uniref:cysteine hydrolase family protein n=1 Tax=Baaleninema simplex TaxID=2862350 RepID=UPI000687005E|nr:isochorismatase family cysteine hydrolase [Baaleninema simplex]